MAGAVVGEFDHASASELQDGDRGAQGGDILFGVEPIRGQQRLPELGRQGGPASGPTDDGLYLAVGQGANAPFFKQDSQRFLHLGWIEAGGLGQSGSVCRPVAGQAEEDLALQIGGIQEIKEADFAADLFLGRGLH